jgi:hypothetical protein
MSNDVLLHPSVATVVSSIPLLSLSHQNDTQNLLGLFAASNISPGQFIVEVKGEILTKSKYKADPSNHYNNLMSPCPLVYFFPDLDLCVDGRQLGNEARFLRRSCFPNAEVRTIVALDDEDQKLHLGIFATQPINQKDEILIGHDWDQSLISSSTSNKEDKNTPSDSGRKVRKRMLYVATELIECACLTSESCLIQRITKYRHKIRQERYPPSVRNFEVPNVFERIRWSAHTF